MQIVVLWLSEPPSLREGWEVKGVSLLVTGRRTQTAAAAGRDAQAGSRRQGPAGRRAPAARGGANQERG